MEKKCVKCYQMCPMFQYRKYKDDKYSNTCKKCLNEMDKIRKKMTLNQNIISAWTSRRKSDGKSARKGQKRGKRWK